MVGIQVIVLKKNPVFCILKIQFQSKIAPNYLFYTPKNQDSQQDLIFLVYILISYSSIQSGGSQSVVPRLATSALSGKLLEMQILSLMKVLKHQRASESFKSLVRTLVTRSCPQNYQSSGSSVVCESALLTSSQAMWLLPMQGSHLDHQ